MKDFWHECRSLTRERCGHDMGGNLLGGRTMKLSLQGKALRRSVATLLVGFLAEAAVGYGGECSLSKTNNTCTLTIDRRNPLAPPTIQMYPKAVLTVEVKNPYYFERYFMDYQS